ncbi:MAG: putative porin [Culturomica sp.]|jgi:hypothetical protein|nr:putative porin [Culturomica sp.]
MKKLLYCIVVCFGIFPAFSQVLPDTEGPERSGAPERLLSRSDSTQNDSVSHQRVTWKWEHGGVYKQFVEPDTNFTNIHNYHYIFRKSIANTYLANFPSPYTSDIFIEKAGEEDFFLFRNIRAYLFRPEDALEFSTTTPFTQLTYFSGGGKGKNETMLDVWHTQNILPYWNAGFRYNLISGDGRYMNQKSKAYNFSVFTNYERDRVAISLFLNQNNGSFLENGGIIDKKYIRDTTMPAENILVNLAEAINTYRNFNFHTLLQYNIGKEKRVPNSQMDSVNVYPFKALMSIRVEDNIRKFREATSDLDFFPETLLDSTETYDVQTNQVYDLQAQLVANEHPKLKYLPGVYAGLKHKQLRYGGENLLTDTVWSLKKRRYTGTWLIGGLFNMDSTALLNFDAHLQMGLVGDYIGDFRVSGFVRQYLHKDRHSYLHADALLESATPNYFLDFYIGNHQFWEQNFSKTKTFAVKGRYVNRNTRSEVGIGWSNNTDYIYFDTTARPAQSAKNIMVLTGWGKQHFKAGNFHFEQTVCIQRSTEEEIISLPLVALYSHNYYQNRIFNKVLGIAAGIDLFYNSEFYGSAYMPSTMQFYNQQREKTGNYPKVDVFIDLDLKRAHLFLKYEHLNYYITNGNYYSALNYPINPAMFKFGIRWNFFD